MWYDRNLADMRYNLTVAFTTLESFNRCAVWLEPDIVEEAAAKVRVSREARRRVHCKLGTN